MHVILADIGNSYIKLSRLRCVEYEVSDATTVVCAKDVIGGPHDQLLDGFLQDAPNRPLDVGTSWLISSVNPVACSSLQSLVESRCVHFDLAAPRFRVLLPDDVPLKTNVEHRSRTGVDRLLASFAACQLTDHDGPVITIDAGTAVTVDYVDQNRVFQGGVIFPGFSTAFHSLQKATAKLPQLGMESDPDGPSAKFGELLIGKSTETAILGGVFSSQVFSIRGIVERMSAASEIAPVVFATGGGLLPLRPELPGQWQVRPNLVLQGLAMIARRDGYAESTTR